MTLGRSTARSFTPSAPSWFDKTTIVEEVPGVPEGERFYLRHRRKVIYHGPTEQAVRDYATAEGVTVEAVEYFEP